VLDLIEKLGLNDFVRDSALGLDTELMSGGKNTPRSIITKLLVARSVAMRPNLLVMEEPLASLNFRDRIGIAQYLADRNKQGQGKERNIFKNPVHLLKIPWVIGTHFIAEFISENNFMRSF